MEQTNQSSVHGQELQRPEPVYDINPGGHFGASAALSSQNNSNAGAQTFSGAWANVHQGLHGHYKDILTTYWQHIINHLENETHDFKMHQLPLARIKKVMKADPEVKMISAEAPILFAKGCDIFITELTMRAWIHAEENKRRTLQRSDIASALSKSDMFDFLIDIVPREETSVDRQKRGITGSAPLSSNNVQQQVSQSMGPTASYIRHIGSGGQDEFNRDAIYTPDVPPSSGPAGYGENSGQIYGEMDGICDYSSMQPQQPIYQVSSQPQSQNRQSAPVKNESSMRNDPNVTRHSFVVRDENDTEVERDFEVS